MIKRKNRVEIAVITGIGQSRAARELPAIQIDTPYGPPSDVIHLGEVHGRSVAFLARRGDAEQIPPHRVPYRANVWALASLGVGSLITSTASSGLNDAFPPGTFVVPDQFIDRTTGRHSTYFVDDPVQVNVVDPFDPTLRGLAVEALLAQQVRVRDFGTAAVTDGPRLLTRAETSSQRAAGADFYNMTLQPEATLARELNMGVVNITFVTDDGGLSESDHGDVPHIDLVRLRAMQAETTLRNALFAMIRDIPQDFRAPAAVAQRSVDTILRRT